MKTLIISMILMASGFAKAHEVKTIATYEALMKGEASVSQTLQKIHATERLGVTEGTLANVE